MPNRSARARGGGATRGGEESATSGRGSPTTWRTCEFSRRDSAPRPPFRARPRRSARRSIPAPTPSRASRPGPDLHLLLFRPSAPSTYNGASACWRCSTSSRARCLWWSPRLPLTRTRPPSPRAPRPTRTTRTRPRTPAPRWTPAASPSSPSRTSSTSKSSASWRRCTTRCVIPRSAATSSARSRRAWAAASSSSTGSSISTAASTRPSTTSSSISNSPPPPSRFLSRGISWRTDAPSWSRGRSSWTRCWTSTKIAATGTRPARSRPPSPRRTPSASSR